MIIQKTSTKESKENKESYYFLHKEELRELRIKNREKQKEYSRQYREKNRELIRKKAAEYQKNKREFIKFIRPLYDLESLQGESFTQFYKRMKKEQEERENKRVSK